MKSLEYLRALEDAVTAALDDVHPEDVDWPAWMYPAGVHTFISSLRYQLKQRGLVIRSDSRLQAASDRVHGSEGAS